MMVVDLPRRWRWAIAVMCALALALLVGFVIVGRAALPDTGRAGIDTPAVAALAEPSPQREFVRAAGSGSGPIEAQGPDEVQLCGGAWVRVQADGSLDPGEVVRAAESPAARERVLATLRNDPGELAYAAALLWAPAQDASACATAECLAAATAAPDAGGGREALARLALSSTDARVYALAFSSCANKRSEGSCQMLSAEQWARLDPGNASPWLFVLAAAKARNDRAAHDEALHRIASSQRSDSGVFDVPGLIANAAEEDDASVAAALAMAMRAMNQAMAAALPPYQQVTMACRGEPLRDANRRQVCSAIAELMTERSDTLIERSIGAGIGKQLGWPAERSDRLRGEFTAYVNTLAAPNEPLRHDSCADSRRHLDRLRRYALGGEVAALRDWVAQSGKTPEEFAAIERAQPARAASSAVTASR